MTSRSHMKREMRHSYLGSPKNSLFLTWFMLFRLFYLQILGALLPSIAYVAPKSLPFSMTN